MRKRCINGVYDLAKNDERVVFIGSDLGRGTLQNFKKEMPDRFFMEGISEQHIVGMAAGLALEGKIPFVNTIGTFLTRRCFEQVAVDVCMHNLNVRLIGNGGGLVYAPLGPTHLAIEDMAIFRALPNMTIIAPADADEMGRLMPLTLDYDGPIYIRLAKGGDSIVSPENVPFKIGKAIAVKEGKDATIITTGVTLQPAVEASNILEKRGVSAGVLHMHTVKPIDTDAVLNVCESAQALVTVEEGTLMGGLGSAVAEIIAKAGMNPPVKFGQIGIPDVFCERYGSQAQLMEYYGITADAIIDKIWRLLGENDS